MTSLQDKINNSNIGLQYKLYLLIINYIFSIGKAISSLELVFTFTDVYCPIRAAIFTKL